MAMLEELGLQPLFKARKKKKKQIDFDLQTSQWPKLTLSKQLVMLNYLRLKESLPALKPYRNKERKTRDYSDSTLQTVAQFQQIKENKGRR